MKNLLKMKQQIRLKIIILLSDPGSKLSVASREVFKRQEIGDNGTKSLSEPDLQQRGDGPQPTMLRVNNSPANPTTEFQAADASLLKISINQQNLHNLQNLHISVFCAERCCLLLVLKKKENSATGRFPSPP